MSMRKRLLVYILFVIMLCMPVKVMAATPLITKDQANPNNCYFHFDGKIWVYSTSRYKSEVSRAVRLLNKKYPVFKVTAAKNKRDVWVKDKQSVSRKNVCAYTVHRTGTITVVRSTMKKMNKRMRILVIAHELCHAAGLNHSNSRKSLMYPYVNKLKIKTLSKADVKALHKAKKLWKQDNDKRKRIIRELLAAEQLGQGIRMWISGRSIMFVVFPERGTTYSSSNPGVMEVYPSGAVVINYPGDAVLTANNNGQIHRFRFRFTY